MMKICRTQTGTYRLLIRNPLLSSLHHIATCKLPDLNSSSEYASLVLVYYPFNPRCSDIFLNLFYSVINENTQK